MVDRRRALQALLRMGAFTSLASSLPALALAQGQKMLRVVVPYAPGGAVDAVTRVVTQRMTDALKQTIVVENKPGASSNIGMQAVAQAAPDGSTLLTASNTLASNKALFPRLGFDPEKDFTPIGAIGYAPLVIVVPADAPYKTLPDLLAAAKANPGKLGYGSAGNGSSGHLATELLKMDAKVDLQHIPYKGGAPAITDLIGGRLALMCINPVEALPHVRSGRLRALAVMDRKPAALLPGVPSTEQLQLKNSQASVWWGLVAPRAMPSASVAHLNSALRAALADPGTVKSMAEMGAVLMPGSPEEFNDFIKQETQKWTRVIQTASIQPD